MRRRTAHILAVSIAALAAPAASAQAPSSEAELRG